jgi:CRISPR-associated endonuclease Csn1
MGKVLGLDLGTNSIGISLRNEDKGGNIINQLEYFSSVIFKSGVGKGKSGEFSYAAQRTSKRSTRRLYQSRKYRIWATLKLLIENGFCPLSMEDLEKWSKYDKTKGLKRQYPIEAIQFERWVRLDFDGDGIADYSSPYQLRSELIEKQFDFTDPINRYKLGRALYHIAQRRGFRSSKGETLQEQEKAEITDIQETDITDALKKSEEKKTGKLVEYMQTHQLKTIGSAFAHLERSGIRVRNSEYQAVRSQYKDEIRQIFDFQDGLDIDSVFYKRLICETKNDGTIFYKRPLRSQKGLVGNCTLEPNKPRCPISHPEFEKFRAWCFINNIRYGDGLKESLTLEQREQLYQDKFLHTRNSFKFEDIRVWIEKRIGKHLDYNNKTINYKDNSTVSGCPISGRFKNLLGEDWENWVFISAEEKINKKTGEVKRIKYTTDDLWHICFSFDEPEYVEEFATTKLSFDDSQVKQLVRIYGAIQQGYGMLSLKATKNINRFLQKGLIYTDAVLLAKLPEIFKDKWLESEESIISQIDGIISTNREQRLLFNIANALIADYKSRDFTDQSGYKNCSYVLSDNDIKDVRNKTVAVIGSKTWANKDEAEQKEILAQIAKLYQSFFESSKRDYFKVPKVADALATFLHNTFKYLPEKDLRKIYHPSMIELYSPADYTRIEDGRSLKLLGSPVIGALKNPMAMRVLHTLRKHVNSLLKTVDENGNALIDEETRIVVETARELNDANMRWAIEAYQRERETENKEYEKIIKEYFPNRDIKDNDIEQVRLTCEQHDIPENGIPDEQPKHKKDKNVPIFKKDVTKYRLWLEQGCRCLYTGKMINIKNLFDDNAYDIEHTIPRSISFDDSLANLTVCEAHFNRSVKKNQLPTQLTNYEDIKLRLLPWFDKVEKLKDNVDFWKSQSKRAQTKDRKDHCIRQRHLWQMELDYWQNKVNRFTMIEVTTGFRNNQLNDTRIITKYAYHYLKTVFNKVEVQKGSVTANFRKMLGVQSLDEKKSRDKHSHHAIDATILTLIPTAAKRDNMLELFYKIQESKKHNLEYSFLEDELLKNRCSFNLDGNVTDLVNYIEDHILINHISKDQVLTPAHKRKRSHGKILWKKDKNGNIMFDEHGKPIPEQWITGDCIRGQIHGETFYGAITQAKKDANGTIIRKNDGSIIVGDETFYVVRKELVYKKDTNSPGFKDWAELENAIVDKDLFRIMKGQFAEGTSFKDACSKGIYMFKKGLDGTIDYSDECKVNKIRHIRCFTSIKNPLKIKRQTYISPKEHKQYYYAEMGDLYSMCKYENENGTEKEYHIWSLYDISNNRKEGIEEIPNVLLSKKEKTLYLTQIITVGDMLLLYKETKQELFEMDVDSLSNRLYVVRGFENPSLIKLVKHTNAQSDKDLGKGESIKDYNKMPEKIRCGINTIKFLKKDIDFTLSAKGIEFK